MFRGHVKGVKKVSAKGHVYYYHRKTMTRIRAPFGTPEFVLEVARLEQAAQRRAALPGTLGMLIDAYRSSPFWADLRPATRLSYDRAFDVLRPLRDMPLINFKPGWVAALRDEIGQKRGRWMANNVRAVLSILAEFGREKELLAENPVSGIRRLRRDRAKPKQNRPWSGAECRIVLDAAPAYLRVPIALAMFAGFRKSDVLRVTKAAVCNGMISVLTAKREVAVTMPIHPILAEILASAPQHGAVTLAANSHGQPWTESGYNSTFGKFIDRLEQGGKIAPGLTMHGLRHTLGTRLREAGADLDDIRRLLGQKTLSMAQHYSETADRSDEAREAVARLDMLGNRTSSKMENPS
jgi:integrase